MSDPNLTIPARRAVNLRSVLLGLLGVLFICGLTPYNDYAVGNTYLVGNFMPVGLLLFFLVIVLLVNAPLWRWRPRMAFSAGELATVMAMMLVSCALPSSGLMRYLPAHLANVHHHANARAVQYGDLVDQLNLPDWAFPTFAGDTVRERANDDVVKYYRSRIPADDADRWGPILRAWITPAITWGALTAFVLGAVLCGSVIVRHQWAENERLAFPLAGVYLSLIESPKPGRSLNALFLNRGFWIAALMVFVIHGVNALRRYDPQHWPEIPLNFDLGKIFSEGVLRFTDWGLKAQTLYFCIVGFAFFIQSSVGFSLWFFYAVLLQLVMIVYAQSGAEFGAAAQQDVFLGGLIPFALMIVWIGRGHWAAVIRRMFGRGRPTDPKGRYLPYSIAGWGLVGCLAGVFMWLTLVGMSPMGAIVLILLIGTFYLVLARIVAETGLIFVQLIIPLNRPWVFMLQDMPSALAVRPSGTTMFWNNMAGSMFAHDMREGLSPFSTNALRIADVAEYDRPNRGQGYGLFACMVLALVVGFVVAGASTLWVEYSYATPLGRGSTNLLNHYAVDITPVSQVLDPTAAFIAPNNGPKDSHNHLVYAGLGVVLVGALSMLRLRFVAWPLHPIGFLMAFGYPLKRIWFSILLGWLAKVMIVKFGGSEMFKTARPVFIGLIVGEAAAASFWLVVSLVMNALGMEYFAISLLPN
ncbi:MAG TPA: DUF6785 family protein [Tepidisphaeraceae bacterium]|jgi:hypothetical protein|nr:DUF6785 family protein [Tepidisphaeraceae bacterium]